ncbi:guanylyl and adenylyl cyclase family member [Volvox carteri f. nagariensis]|uniref:Guanylyl and adenylyl cyclase family member n=1 Tax=Volvox carteri f. nagariensis TaxID=3068 RepID=D8UJX0_VOLCA|nr:guanylyl and adenylyl cyclase family member [Volvox carteri f. nagariensis]EFJ39993.1 guanylyl and adenylyl cyclase family member [Volvox carteri f. nagariensis]|eukprot:XP_002958958.1 guanylyl and adenylyl cyclase family member [Volvox carteri f. nagariensis]
MWCVPRCLYATQGFTTTCSSTTPFTVMTFLNDLYSRFDGLVDIYKVYKVETIGDCYMVAGGLVAYDEDGYKSVISGTEDPLHAAMLRVSRAVLMPDTGAPVQLRVGLHSGPVTSGVVGDTMPRFCLFGDTVNVASRMESTCSPGRIHVSSATQSLLPNEAWRDLGMTDVKGKGAMHTYEWAGDVDGPLDGEQVTRVLGLYL